MIYCKSKQRIYHEYLSIVHLLHVFIEFFFISCWYGKNSNVKTCTCAIFIQLPCWHFSRHFNNTWAKLFIKRTGCILWYTCIYLDTACLLYIHGCRWLNPRNPDRQTEGGGCHKCACASQCRCHTWQNTHSIDPKVTSLRALKSMI